MFLRIAMFYNRMTFMKGKLANSNASPQLWPMQTFNPVFI